MVFAVPEGAFKPLHFTKSDEQAIIDLADRIIAETLRVNEEFIANDRKLPKQEWKLLKAKEQVQVYRQRKVKEGTPQRPRLLSGTILDNHLHQNNYSDSSGSGQSSNNPTAPIRTQHSMSTSSSSQRESDSAYGESIVEDAKPEHIPLVVAHGLLPGTIEDVSFGTLGHTEYTWKLRNSYVRENEFDGYKILATIHSPTHDDPFRYLGIKWITRPFGAFITRRDFVFIEATGMALDSNGERVSYNLLHSIEFKQIPELKTMDIIRAKFSTCYISRQHDTSMLEVYCRSFSDLGGDIMDSVSANMHSDIILGIANTVACSYVKKLTWQMQRNRRSSSQLEKHAPAKHCEMCSKSLNKLGMFASGSACQVCRKVKSKPFCWEGLLCG